MADIIAVAGGWSDPQGLPTVLESDNVVGVSGGGFLVIDVPVQQTANVGIKIVTGGGTLIVQAALTLLWAGDPGFAPGGNSLEIGSGNTVYVNAPGTISKGAGGGGEGSVVFVGSTGACQLIVNNPIDGIYLIDRTTGGAASIYMDVAAAVTCKWVVSNGGGAPWNVDCEAGGSITFNQGETLTGIALNMIGATITFLRLPTGLPSITFPTLGDGGGGTVDLRALSFADATTLAASIDNTSGTGTVLMPAAPFASKVWGAAGDVYPLTVWAGATVEQLFGDVFDPDTLA